MFHVYSRSQKGCPQSDADDTQHEFDTFEDAVTFQQNEVHCGYVVESKRFERVFEASQHITLHVADDAFVSLAWTRTETINMLELRTVCEFKAKQPEKSLWLKIVMQDGTQLGYTPLNSDLQLCDGSYGLIEYFQDQLGEHLGQSVADAVENEILTYLQSHPNDTKTVLGLTGRIVDEAD